jgi:hypothetical protein
MAPSYNNFNIYHVPTAWVNCAGVLVRQRELEWGAVAWTIPARGGSRAILHAFDLPSNEHVLTSRPRRCILKISYLTKSA